MARAASTAVAWLSSRALAYQGRSANLRWARDRTYFRKGRVEKRRGGGRRRAELLTGGFCQMPVPQSTPWLRFLFPHQTGRADLPDPAFRLASPHGPRRTALKAGVGRQHPNRGSLRPAAKLTPTPFELNGADRHEASHRPLASVKVRQKSRPLTIQVKSTAVTPTFNSSRLVIN
jgi:hypothetical protein